MNAATPSKFARWQYVSRRALEDAGERVIRNLAVGSLLGWCDEHHLRTVEEPTVRFADESPLSPWYDPDRFVALAEVRALGTDPATRMPHGWRGWLRAAFRRD